MFDKNPTSISIDGISYDFKTANDVTYSIVKIDLNSYKESIEILNSHELIVTITSSGKIKLVRERMEINF